jgi:hypothetical protein
VFVDAIVGLVAVIPVILIVSPEDAAAVVAPLATSVNVSDGNVDTVAPVVIVDAPEYRVVLVVVSVIVSVDAATAENPEPEVCKYTSIVAPVAKVPVVYVIVCATFATDTASGPLALLDDKLS